MLSHTLDPISPRPRPPTVLASGTSPTGDRLALTSLCLTWNDRPWLPVMGEYHFTRGPAQTWDAELAKVKAGGVEIVSTYVFWNHHEEEPGCFDWTGRRDLRRFVQACASHGLWVIARIGPFCHGEARNGGLPDWLYGQPFEARGNDPRYLELVQRLYREIARQLPGMLFSDGGPVIGIQCENEFMDSAAPWETTHLPATAWTPRGSGGKEHHLTLKRLAIEAGLAVPLHLSTGWGNAPVDTREMLPLFGGYAYHAWLDDPATQSPTDCFLFRDMPRRQSGKFDPTAVPYACCELGGGMQAYYRNRPIVPPESVEAMHVVQLGSGSNLMGYYVYHGGTNPVGQRSFLNEHRCPRISYDYQAPLGEFGQTRPHYHLLRRQALFLESFGATLATMPVHLPSAVAGMAATDTETIRWAVRADDDGGFIFLSNFQDHLPLPERRDLHLQLRTASGETVKLPASGRGLRLRAGACAILPFGLRVGGLRLRGATVQPLTQFDDDGIPHLVCFAPDGFPAEYAFDADAIASFSGEVEILAGKDGQLVLGTTPGLDSRLTLNLRTQTQVRITTLTDDQSRQLHVAELAGRQRLLLTPATLTVSGERVRLTQPGQVEFELAVYPPLSPPPSTGFQHFRWQTEARTIEPTVEPGAPGKTTLRLPADALDGVHDLMLRIRYTGDTASAWLDGRLIHDHFWNGSPWELAVRTFAPRILATGLVLILTPPPEDGRVTYTSMAAIQNSEPSAANPLRFLSIAAEPVYACDFDAATAATVPPPHPHRATIGSPT